MVKNVKKNLKNFQFIFTKTDKSMKDVLADIDNIAKNNKDRNAEFESFLD